MEFQDLTVGDTFEFKDSEGFARATYRKTSHDQYTTRIDDWWPSAKRTKTWTLCDLSEEVYLLTPAPIEG